MIRRGQREEEQETESLRVHNERDITINGAQPLWAKPTASPFTWGTDAILIAISTFKCDPRKSQRKPFSLGKEKGVRDCACVMCVYVCVRARARVCVHVSVCYLKNYKAQQLC